MIVWRVYKRPGKGVRGAKPPEAESILSFTSANGAQICQFLLPCKLLKYAFWATVCKTVHHMLLDVVCLSVLSVMVYCDQTVGWINMPLGMEVGLRPGHIAQQPSIFDPCLLWPNGWMD